MTGKVAVIARSRASGDEAIQSRPRHKYGARSLRHGISAVIARRREPPKQSRLCGATGPMAAFVAPPFLDCFALAALGLAMTGRRARARSDGERRAGAQ